MNVLEARRRLLGAGVYKKTVTGNPAIAKGSLARMYPGIEMQGWTEQSSTTGAQLWQNPLDNTFNGVTLTVEDGWIVLNGTCTSSGNFILNNNTLVAGDYIFSCGTDGIFPDNASALVQVYSPSTTLAVMIANNAPTSTPILNVMSDTSDFQYRVRIEGGFEYINAKVRPMLNAGSTALPWEPYTGGQPSPSPDYPQPIVSAGLWNEAAQKWEYEIEVSGNDGFSQTVTLTSDRPLTKWDKLEKRDGQWGWVYKSAEIVLDGSERWYLTGVTSDEYQGFALRSSDYNAMKSNLRLVCDRFAYSKSDKINTCKQDNSEYGLRFVVSTEYVPNKTVAEFKNWLQSNPITVLYHLAEPVFVPLSASEQEQMNTLHTFRPTTVLSNDADCEMTLTYKTRKSMEVTT